MGNQKNQGVFVTNCFLAAGSTYFTLHKSQSKQTSDNVEYQRMIYKGDRQITDTMKNTFPNPFRHSDLAAYFSSNFKQDKVREIMTAFSIPLSINEDKNALSLALASQFQFLIQSANDDVDDIVFMEYQKMLNSPVSPTNHRFSPLILGDNAWSEFKPQQKYEVNCYDKITHTWVIHNTGNQVWRGRKLVFINSAEVRPRTDNNSLDIPDTNPGQNIKITTVLDARGFEGTFDCVWQMQDSGGNDCFPNNYRMFQITIKTKFIPQ